MKPEIEITVDEMGVTYVEVSLMGSHIETIKLSGAVVDALRVYFVEGEGK